MALEITDSNIAEIINKNKITVVDFWAEWCGPCRILGPIIDELSNENSDIAIGKLNVDENSTISVKYGIRGIPAVLFFKDGELVDRVVGVRGKFELQTIINNLK